MRLFSTLYCLHIWEYKSVEYYIWLSIYKRIFRCVVYLIIFSNLGSRNNCFKSWTKRNTVFFMSRFIHLFICWPITFPNHLFLPSLTTDPPTSDLQQEPPGVGHQTNVSKNQEQISTSSRDIVGVDQPTNLSGYSLWLDQPATSSG